MADEPSIVFSENIKRLRRARGLTQRALADALGVTFQAVSKWENGRAAPDIFVLPGMASILGCQIDDLFRREQG